jgi:hypothetical protein
MRYAFQTNRYINASQLTLRKMLGIWTEAKALAIDISFGTQY